MKYLAIISMIGGVLAMLLAVIAVLTLGFLGIAAAGYIRGANSLFLLALALMVYKRVYQSK
jgi:hypothetical protein